MQKCSFGDSPLAATQTLKQATMLNAFTTTDRRLQELSRTKVDLKWKVLFIVFALGFIK